MKLLWNYLKQYRKILFGSLGLALVNQVFSLLDPQIFRLLIDNYATKIGQISRTDFVRGVILLLLASVGVALVSRIAKNFQDYYVNVVTQKLGTKMYADSVSHSFSLPYSIFEDQRSGEFLQKLQKARTDAQTLVASFVNTIFFSLVGLIFVWVYAFIVHWSIGLVYIIIVPFFAITTFVISKKIKTAQKIINQESAGLAGSTTETLRNVELVKSLGLERQEIGRLNRVNDLILGLELKKVKLIRKLSFIQGTLINALRSLLLLLLLWLIYIRTITFGEFFSLWFYSFAVFGPLADLGLVSSQYQETLASMERLEGILHLKPEKKPENPVTLAKLKVIEFKGVDFGYKSSNQVALENINVSINAGQTVAFVGPSGSGKTTMVKLIVGLYRPLRGNIEYNNVDINHLDIEALRSRIGLVSQDTQLFAGTIRENLLFANPKATDENCLEALRSASALSLFKGGGEDLETKIGEGGIKLSGGEKQRLAIARALLRNPDLIIFDEATSSLDSITEEQITQTIRNIGQQRKDLINILIAHRLSTVMHADMIYVLEKGKVVEKGRHGELLIKNGLYSALWRQQVGGKD